MRKTSYLALAFLFTGLSAHAAGLLGIAPASNDVSSRAMAQGDVNVQVPVAPIVGTTPTVNLPRVNAETSTGVNPNSSANSRDVPNPSIPTAPPLQSGAPTVDTSISTTSGTSGSTGTTPVTPTIRGTAGITTTSTGTEPEIVRLNETGRMNNSVTPRDSATTRADLYVSNTIRQSLVKGGLSGTSRNVKIVTTNGRVTLSGPVNSEAEKTKIESLARGAAGSVTVDSQLKVKGKR